MPLRSSCAGLLRREPSPGAWRLFLTQWILRCVSLAALLLLPGCTKETLFQSDFNPTADDQPPAAAQKVGTAAFHGPPGSVLVIAPPVTPSDKWVQITRPTNDSSIAGFQGTFSAFRGDGKYTFSTTVFMPMGSGVATIQFERFGQPVSSVDSFLHLDLMPDNKVRIDHQDAPGLGTFARGQPFIVQVVLDIKASSSSAQIALSGPGATGTVNHAIPPPLQGMARQFGAVRLWMGLPHTGAFSATNIAVTRHTD